MLTESSQSNEGKDALRANYIETFNAYPPKPILAPPALPILVTQLLFWVFHFWPLSFLAPLDEVLVAEVLVAEVLVAVVVVTVVARRVVDNESRGRVGGRGRGDGLGFRGGRGGGRGGEVAVEVYSSVFFLMSNQLRLASPY